MRIGDAPQYENALHQQELLLRSADIRTLSQLAHLDDNLDSLDLTGNMLRELKGKELPKLNRLKTLLLAHNKIVNIDAEMAEPIANLETLSLAYNKISDIKSLQFLTNLPKLRHLCLEGNPIIRSEDYRSAIIRLQPRIRYLDFERVTEAERSSALPKEPQSIEGKEKKAELLRRLENASSIEEIDAIENELVKISEH